jgi:hypothetical protein
MRNLDQLEIADTILVPFYNVVGVKSVLFHLERPWRSFGPFVAGRNTIKTFELPSEVVHINRLTDLL